MKLFSGKSLEQLIRANIKFVDKKFVTIQNKGKNMKKIIIAVILICSVIAFSGFAFATEHATKEECVAMCKKAAKMVEEKGLDATLKAINDKNGPFVWKDTYVFALSTKSGGVLAHPLKSKLIGKNLMGLKDVDGVLMFVEFLKAGNSKAGEGWVDYKWPKPGEKKPSKKETFVYKVKGQDVSMCAGVYE